MPLVPSQTWLAEKLAAYKYNCHIPNSANGEFSRQCSAAGFSVSELIPAICSRILATDPALVADVAAGRTQRQALADLIGRAAEQESLRSAFYHADLQQQVMDFLFGYGPLQPYVENEDISDIDLKDILQDFR